MTLLFFSFAAGLATILAPCIWPLLPIVLSASSGEGKRRPLGLVLGLMTSFLILTLAVSYIEKAFGVDPNIFRTAAVVVIGLLGFSMVFPKLGTYFEVVISKLLRPFQGQTQAGGTGFGAGYVSGFSMGFLWAPCAGPILAAVATVAATRAINLRIALVAVSYALGIGVPLFFLSMGSSRFFKHVRGLNSRLGFVQQAFGVIMIGAALLIYTNYDKKIQLRVLNAFPSYGRVFARIENNGVVQSRLDALRPNSTAARVSTPAGKDGLADLGPAPELIGINHWLNSPPLTMKALRGKVVLIDFWTYSCINCLRTLPYIKRWNQDYGPAGLVIIGVHAPEFAFEKKTANVQDALKEFGITYPVAQDNDFATWNAYNNSYWPAEYLIDAQGHIRLAHFGEGHYDEMDAAIRTLLGESGHPVSTAAALPVETGGDDDITAETYLGLDRMERFYSRIKPSLGDQRFVLPKTLARDHFAYDGDWNITNESAVAKQGAALELEFHAADVYLVIGPSHQGGVVAVFLDGKPIKAEGSGSDVKNSRVILDGHRLYRLVDLRGKIQSHRLRLVFDGGTAVYAFTFG